VTMCKCVSAREHRPEWASGENMDVEVGDLLMTVEADIGEQAIAWRDEALVARDLADRAYEARDLFGAAALRKIVPADIGGLGDNKDVQRCLRIDVMESERMLVLIDFLTRQFAAQD